MRLSRPAKFAGFAACLALSGVLVGAATGATGAFFTDTESGTYGGTLGSIQINGYGGGGVDGLDINFQNMLPGEPQTLTLSFQNTGANAQDVWIVFPNADALHSINDLGTFGEVHLKANNDVKFESANLNDDSGGGCGGIFDEAGCWPMPQKVQLFSNVAPGGSGNFSFTFNYSGALSNPAYQGQPWNPYPLSDFPNFTHFGLPFQLVATQVGQTP